MMLRLSPSVSARNTVRGLGAGAAQDVLVGPVAPDRLAPEGGWQAVECAGDQVHDDDLVIRGVERSGKERADSSAADDDCLHRAHLLRHGLARDPHGARSVLEHVGHDSPDREVAAEPLAVGQADDQQVGPPFDGLVDEGGADVAGLDQDGLEAPVEVLGLALGEVEHALGVLGPFGHVGVERQGPVDLDDVHGHDLRARLAGHLDDESNDPLVVRATVHRDDRALERCNRLVAHGTGSSSGSGLAARSGPRRAALEQ